MRSMRLKSPSRAFSSSCFESLKPMAAIAVLTCGYVCMRLSLSLSQFTPPPCSTSTYTAHRPVPALLNHNSPSSSSTAQNAQA